MQITRARSETGEVGLALTQDGQALGRLAAAGPSLADLLRLPAAELRQLLEAATRTARPGAGPLRVLAPIDGQTEVWAAGVTYKRSEEARIEESATPDIYSKIYRAERPELFFKARY